MTQLATGEGMSGPIRAGLQRRAPWHHEGTLTDSILASRTTHNKKSQYYSRRARDQTNCLLYRDVEH